MQIDLGRRTMTPSLPPQAVLGVAALDEFLELLYELYIHVGPQIFGHSNIFPMHVFPLWPQLHRDALLASSFAGDRVPGIASPPSFRPFDLADGIGLRTPLLHVCECLEPLQELLLAVWLKVWLFARRGRFRYDRFADGSDCAFASRREQLVFEGLYARLAGRDAPLALLVGIGAPRALVRWLGCRRVRQRRSRGVRCPETAGQGCGRSVGGDVLHDPVKLALCRCQRWLRFRHVGQMLAMRFLAVVFGVVEETVMRAVARERSL